MAGCVSGRILHPLGNVDRRAVADLHESLRARRLHQSPAADRRHALSEGRLAAESIVRSCSDHGDGRMDRDWVLRCAVSRGTADYLEGSIRGSRTRWSLRMATVQARDAAWPAADAVVRD